MLAVSQHNLPINPFLYDLKVDLLEFKEETYVVTVVEGMNLPTGQMSATIKQVESQSFTKVYDIPYKTGFFKTLTKSELLLFNYLIYNLEPETDIIDLDIAKVCERLEWNESLYRNVVSGLTTHSVIQRISPKHKDYRYWINPKIMFRGDRKAFVQERLPDNCKVVRTFVNKHYLGSVTSSS